MPLAFWKVEWDIQFISVFLQSPLSPLCTIWSSFIGIIHRCSHRENPLLSKRQTEFPSVNDFLGTIPIKGWNSLGSGFLLAQQLLQDTALNSSPALLPSSCSNTLKTLLPWVGELLGADSCQEIPPGDHLSSPWSISSTPRAVEVENVPGPGRGLELNVLSGLSQPKLFWGCDSMTKSAPPTLGCQCCWQITPLQWPLLLNFTEDYQSGLQTGLWGYSLLLHWISKVG